MPLTWPHWKTQRPLRSSSPVQFFVGFVEQIVNLLSETIQELTQISQALASAQEETSDLSSNELKAKWEADMRYGEFNEPNKMLHSQIEALHIKLAEKDRGIAFGSTPQTLGNELQKQVVSYLRWSNEIAESVICRLKQQKLRLQSQIESALKAAELAQASLHAEQVQSRASQLTEEEFKSLQLKVRELTLLRETNVQLREETRHNFEGCMKLCEGAQEVKIEIENLERILNDRDRGGVLQKRN
ncbi:Nuclear-pore anchor [Forsythia ovata]|uniref:Nuclear-pore anchor n=1 Tax=Forsythia ovata TaxID=205694 RepID=A0ABD1RJG3_9LAMI